MKFMLIAWFVVVALFLLMELVGAATELDVQEELFGVQPEKHIPLTSVVILWLVSIIVAMVATLRFLILL